MGRHRTIDREQVLDAAERVVVREGAANLTLDAVATEAGISKASVLYDYKSKRALVRTLIERRVATEEKALTDFVAAQGDRPDALIRGFLAAATRPYTDDERSVGLNLCAALAQGEELREPVQQSIGTTLRGIEASSPHPRGARLAFLAIEGLVLLEWFGLHSFPEDERRSLIEEIGWLSEQTPPAPAGG